MSIRTMIVDDSSVMRKIVERSLRQAGLDISEVLEAGNGAEALGILQNKSVDLILSDINMPVMDGLTFIDNIRANEGWNSMPIIVITTEGAEAMAKDAIKKGANNLIKKPFTPEQIKEKLAPYFA